MALEKVRDLLAEAQRVNTSIIAFDACDYNTIYACIKGAEAARRPVIVMLYPTMSSLCSFGSFAATVKDLAKTASVPVGLHLDHCSELPGHPIRHTGRLYFRHGGRLRASAGGKYCLYQIRGGHREGV